jgi:hypothetical protein
MIAFIQRWIIAAFIGLAALTGVYFYAYNSGINHQKDVYIKAQLNADEKVVEKNQDLQEVANKTDEQQVVYKDRIVTKYQTITNEVIKYEKTPVASEFLDPEFIRLHDSAAATYDQDTIARRASGNDGETKESGVTAGQAIATISRNYKQYYECARRLDGLQKFYIELQESVNK